MQRGEGARGRGRGRDAPHARTAAVLGGLPDPRGVVGGRGGRRAGRDLRARRRPHGHVHARRERTGPGERAAGAPELRGPAGHLPERPGVPATSWPGAPSVPPTCPSPAAWPTWPGPSTRPRARAPRSSRTSSAAGRRDVAGVEEDAERALTARLLRTFVASAPIGMAAVERAVDTADEFHYSYQFKITLSIRRTLFKKAAASATRLVLSPASFFNDRVSRSAIST